LKSDPFTQKFGHARYAREIYISQTPELTAMADTVIDLDRYRDRRYATGLQSDRWITATT